MRANAFFSGPQIVAFIIALAVLGLAMAGIVWIGRVIRGELGSSGARGAEPRRQAAPYRVNPGMKRQEPMVPAQVAPASPASPASPAAPAAPATPATPVATVVPAAPSPPTLPADIPPAMRAILDVERPRFWCPMCGTELQLPTFPPLLARCPNCGKKSVIRAEEGGRYVVIVSPPPKLT